MAAGDLLSNIQLLSSLESESCPSKSIITVRIEATHSSNSGDQPTVEVSSVVLTLNRGTAGSTRERDGCRNLVGDGNLLAGTRSTRYRSEEHVSDGRGDKFVPPYFNQRKI